MCVCFYVFLSDESLFPGDFIKTEIDLLKYQQCFNALKCVQYLYSAWFLDGRTSILSITFCLNISFCSQIKVGLSV